MTLVIGLTGSIATGKSTVSKMFDDFDIPVVDADKIAREVVEPKEKAYKEIVELFGNEILQNNGELDRKKLGSIIFGDETKRKQLNNIIHPAIRGRMHELKDAHIASGKECVVLDIPLLFESKLTHYVDKIIVVYVDEEVQLKRLMARDQSTRDEAEQRIQSQMPVKEKVKLAHGYIDNNGTTEDSCEQLKSILREWDVLS